MTEYREEVVAATADDLLGPSDEVTWRARQFGLAFELTVRIVEFDRPRHFRDSMVSGPFAWMHHDHEFREREEITTMEDTFAYALPLGPLGRIADFLAVRRRLRSLLERRCRAIKEAAERG
jgi:ligand-binding SRPBCC domain-containing protein